MKSIIPYARGRQPFLDNGPNLNNNIFERAAHTNILAYYSFYKFLFKNKNDYISNSRKKIFFIYFILKLLKIIE